MGWLSGAMSAAQVMATLAAANPAMATSPSTPAKIVQAPPDGPVSGFADDLPLSVVVGQIVPPAVSVAYGATVNQQAPTSWHGGPSWKAALGAAIAPQGLRAYFTAHSVRIQPATAKPPTDIARMNGVGAKPPPPPPPPTWTITAGGTLHQLLVGWCHTAGPSRCSAVVWQTAYQYPLMGSATITGAFPAAVNQVLRAFQTAAHPPEGTLTGNHVLIIHTAGGRGG